MTIKIRRYISGDEEHVVKILRENFDEYRLADLSPTSWLEVSMLENEWGPNLTWLAEEDGSIVGLTQGCIKNLVFSPTLLKVLGLANTAVRRTLSHQESLKLKLELVTKVLEESLDMGFSVVAAFTDYSSLTTELLSKAGFIGISSMSSLISIGEEIDNLRRSCEIRSPSYIALREAEKGDYEELNALYYELSTSCIGLVARTEKFWIKGIVEGTIWRSWIILDEESSVTFVAENKLGDIVGFIKAILWDKTPLRELKKGMSIVEFYFTELGAGYRLLAEVLKVAKSEGIHIVEFYVPEIAPYVDILKPYTLKVEEQIFMCKVLSFKKLFDELKEYFTLNVYGLEDFTLTINIYDNGKCSERIHLSFDGSELYLSEEKGSLEMKVNRGILTKMIFGVLDPVTCYYNGDIEVNVSRCLRVVAALIQPMTLWIWPSDRW